MDTWEPTSAKELEALIVRELAKCTPEQREFFSRIRIPLRAVPIPRFGQVESIFVVAQQGDVVVYYEDVEEGFNLSTLAPDGSIESPGYEQWELRHVLYRLAP
jgi:hypothetical protein